MERRSLLMSGRSHVFLLAGAALVFLSILAHAGIGPAFLYRQYEAREVMERRKLRGLADSALTVLCLTETEFDELLGYGCEELEVDEVLYDIVSVERVAGRVVVRAICDTDEMRLNKELESIQLAQAKDQKGKRGHISLLASWAPYCEAWSAIQFGDQPEAEALFPIVLTMAGRQSGPVDPDPPRV